MFYLSYFSLLTFRVCSHSEIELDGITEFAQFVENVTVCMVASVAGEKKYVGGMVELFKHLAEKDAAEMGELRKSWREDPPSESLKEAIEIVAAHVMLSKNDLSLYVQMKDDLEKLLRAAAGSAYFIVSLQEISQLLQESARQFTSDGIYPQCFVDINNNNVVEDEKSNNLEGNEADENGESLTKKTKKVVRNKSAPKK